MENQALRRHLKMRHLTMIALGGSIGTGLFLASGQSISTAGPGGALLGYLLMGAMVYFLMTSLGEMATLMPSTGAFCDYSGRFISPSFGFAMGYNYFYNWAITAAADLTAASVLMEYWFPGVPLGYFAAFFLLVIATINFLNVRFYGESEYWLSLIKVIAVIAFITVGAWLIWKNFSDPTLSARHLWHMDQGPFRGGALGILSVFLVVGFSFQGTELVGVAAGEVENPRKNVPKAIQKTFWRILLFYVLAIAIMASLIPSNSPLLVPVNEHNVGMSPFTLIFQQAGFRYADTLVNFIILTAVLSACNASVYTAARTLWYLGRQGLAPKKFSHVNKRGVPTYALALTLLFGLLPLLLWSFNEGKTLFTWLINLSALAGFIAWFGIAWSHLRFRKAYALQGKKLSDLPYKARFFPLGPLLAAALCLFVIGGQMLTQTWTWSNVLANYFGLGMFLILWALHKLRHPTARVDLMNAKFD